MYLIALGSFLVTYIHSFYEGRAHHMLGQFILWRHVDRAWEKPNLFLWLANVNFLCLLCVVIYYGFGTCQVWRISIECLNRRGEECMVRNFLGTIFSFNHIFLFKIMVSRIIQRKSIRVFQCMDRVIWDLRCIRKHYTTYVHDDLSLSSTL